VQGVEPGPLVVQVRHALATLQWRDRAVDDALTRGEPQQIQQALDRRCLVGVHINPEMRVKVARGPAQAELVARQWRRYLVKVHNEAGTTAALGAAADGESLDVRMWEETALTGMVLEYHVLGIYGREVGWREASLMFDVGQGTQDLGFRNEAPVLFACLPPRYGLTSLPAPPKPPQRQ
jgi:hypothetical protein